MSFAWKIIGGLVAAVLLLAGGLFVGASGWWSNLWDNAIEQETETRESLVIRAVTNTQEISLMSLGVQGIVERTENTTFLGHRIPGSDRASFLQYEFNAKLGVDGEDVRITQISENVYSISVPEFMFIGHDAVRFKLAVEKNGVLSLLTPDIDTVEMTNEILNGESRQELVEKYEEQLQQQTKLFYSSIVSSVDPTVELRFKFRGSNR